MKKIFSLLFMLSGSILLAQISFTDATSLLNTSSSSSGVAMAVVDMNNDGLDDVVRLNNGTDLEIEFQQEDGSFQLVEVGNFDSPWAMSIADVDRNNYNDIIVGGAYDGIQLVLANANGTAYTISELNGPGIFLQNSNFADIDNDGSIDFFACHDDGLSSIYKNDGSGFMDHDTSLLNPESTVPSDNSGNYGSIWTDYDNDGDLDLYISKCRLGVNDPGDGRRRNLLFQNDGNNNFTDVAEAAGLLPLAQTWSTNFEDIDNDGDFDAVMINHPDQSRIYENNGDGTFTDITAISGIADGLLDVGFGIQVAMEDFDNNGFIDIIMTTLNGNDHIFMNEGNLSFSEIDTTLNTNTTMQSTALGDVNNDGFIDILAGYADGFNTPSGISDQLFINNGNDNNYIKINLEGVESNFNAIGAKVIITGGFGTQIREVRAGESYGTQNSLTNHFGLSTFDVVESVIIEWPSGLTETLNNVAANETYTIVEGEVLGVNENSATPKFSVFPNPASNILTIRLGDLAEAVDMTIIDVTGKLVLRQSIDQTETTLNVSAFTSGLYFVKIGTTTEKFVKQ